MTVSITSGWIIAIVVAVALFGWLAAMLWADAHPGWKHQSKLPKYEVTGGAFQALDGGRQLMPIPGERPAATEEEAARSGGVPGQRAGSDENLAQSGRIPGQRTAARQGATAGQGATADQGATASSASGRAGEPHLTGGSKLRLVSVHPIRGSRVGAAGSAGRPLLLREHRRRTRRAERLTRTVDQTVYSAVDKQWKDGRLGG
jgi:hypothetical protein